MKKDIDIKEYEQNLNKLLIFSAELVVDLKDKSKLEILGAVPIIREIISPYLIVLIKKGNIVLNTKNTYGRVVKNGAGITFQLNNNVPKCANILFKRRSDFNKIIHLSKISMSKEEMLIKLIDTVMAMKETVDFIESMEDIAEDGLLYPDLDLVPLYIQKNKIKTKLLKVEKLPDMSDYERITSLYQLQNSAKCTNNTTLMYSGGKSLLETEFHLILFKDLGKYVMLNDKALKNFYNIGCLSQPFPENKFSKKKTRLLFAQYKQLFNLFSSLLNYTSRLPGATNLNSTVPQSQLFNSLFFTKEIILE